ncbi:hypothetical protein [Nostoc sp. UHCC 0252]|uniref:hypothetical protein n=1 Tax=Nostoc sp. UHCC 0252 TaxID=3110241 RepID=UPI002B20F762|nr:hypothetical protein [Nostoc sp. UHCC 0252]MEA5606261.1 hypothetical protein [Nostoc sp. UHCC 0252]
MFKKTTLITLIISFLLPQIAQAAINRDTLTGGALGILQCQHTRGDKTRMVWKLIVNDASKPINAINFRLKTNGEVRDIYSAVIPPTVDYQTFEIFDGLQKQVTISGEAYNISLSGVYRYSLRKPLSVQCN